MVQPLCRFVWHELLTTDTVAAARFYGSVIGWGTQDVSPPGMQYTMFTADAGPAGGLMAQPEHMRQAGAPPSWFGYVGVQDVDASAAQARSLGGSVIVAPQDIPEVGRFAVIADPQGAVIGLFRYSGADMSGPSDGTAPGHVGWNELMAAGWPSAFAFYAAMFGWTKGDAVDIGAMGTYQLFAAGEQTLGGVFNKPSELPMPFWLYYVNVGAIDAAAKRLTEAGGTVLNGPMEVPNGQWIVQARDPQGAIFALVGSR